jgi:hypothetical protein
MTSQAFSYRCTVNQQIFYLITNSGSCKNIIGRETVVKLGLNMEKHVEP